MQGVIEKKRVIKKWTLLSQQWVVAVKRLMNLSHGRRMETTEDAEMVKKNCRLWYFTDKKYGWNNYITI